MPRAHRIEVPGGYYHVVSRGNNGQPIFDDPLRVRWLHILENVKALFDWRVYGWALMTNHYHLLLQLGDGGLSQGMRMLNHVFALESNASFGRINHCFGDRFWSVHIEAEPHLFSTLRYTLWNPARAGLAAHPEDSPWTSFAATISADRRSRPLDRGRLLSHFGPDPARARQAFSRFVAEGRERCLAPRREPLPLQPVR